MQTKSNPDEIESFLTDASFIREGHADRVALPESIEEISEVLANANRERVPVTVSGAGTGTAQREPGAECRLRAAWMVAGMPGDRRARLRPVWAGWR